MLIQWNLERIQYNGFLFIYVLDSVGETASKLASFDNKDESGFLQSAYMTNKACFHLFEEYHKAPNLMS